MKKGITGTRYKSDDERAAARFEVRLTQDEKELIENYAKSHGMSKSKFLLMCFKKYIEK